MTTTIPCAAANVRPYLTPAPAPHRPDRRRGARVLIVLAILCAAASVWACLAPSLRLTACPSVRSLVSIALAVLCAAVAVRPCLTPTPAHHRFDRLRGARC
jgi:hypothetical protein